MTLREENAQTHTEQADTVIRQGRLIIRTTAPTAVEDWLVRGGGKAGEKGREGGGRGRKDEERGESAEYGGGWDGERRWGVCEGCPAGRRVKRRR